MVEEKGRPISNELGSYDSWLEHPLQITEQSWPEEATPLVSICSITYNHGAFIRECIDGFLMQETTFPVEVLIHDDASTDATADIVREYESRHPDLIKPVYQEENQYSKGVKPNKTFNYPRARGKYIALCEGDDYWTDPHKLQKQVEFLEAHPDYVITHHDAMVVDEFGVRIAASVLPAELRRDFSVDELITGAWILTLTACFRNVLQEFPWEIIKVLNGDTFLFSLLGNYGRSRFLGDSIEPAAYRVHEGGVWSSQGDSARKAFQRINTFYWLRHYYMRSGKVEQGLACGRHLPNQNELYALSSIEEVEANLAKSMHLLGEYSDSEEMEHEARDQHRQSISSKLYMRAAFAHFRWQSWESGCHYLDRAIQMDPSLWEERGTIEEMIVDQLVSILDLHDMLSPVLVNDFLAGLVNVPSCRVLSKRMVRRIVGRVNAALAYRSYLLEDKDRVQRFTWQAIKAEPNLLADRGMLSRAFKV